ncbi:MAG: MFS transporter [Candidatus Omnitrophica bacterium]|nr:MFS transporter [Candidatus Omnitrophota bacterium]
MRKLLLKLSILSISLLTVMSSAAISPTLAKIKQAFIDTEITVVKLVLTLPSLFIIPSSLLAGWLVGRIKKKNVLLIGLLIYFFAGIAGGFASNIKQLLFMRAVFGVGAGLIIPLSTSLIADFFEKEERTKMMGYSGSVSHFGGVIFLLISGWLAVLNWRYAFYVCGLALISFLMILFWLPDTPTKPIPKQYQYSKLGLPFGVYICAVLGVLMMIAFYAAPTNLAMFIESERKMYTSTTPLFQNKEELSMHLERGTVSDTLRESFRKNGINLSLKAKLELVEPRQAWSITDRNIKYIVKKEKDTLVIYRERLARPGIAGYLLSTMTMVGVVIGFILAPLMRLFRSFFATVSIVSMAIGYGLLGVADTLGVVFLGLVFIGFSSGVLMPLLLLRVAKITPEPLRAMAMAVLSIGIYLGQFISPVFLKIISFFAIFGQDPFRQQFNFLAVGLGIAALVSFMISLKRKESGLEDKVFVSH